MVVEIGKRNLFAVCHEVNRSILCAPPARILLRASSIQPDGKLLYLNLYFPYIISSSGRLFSLSKVKNGIYECKLKKIENPQTEEEIANNKVYNILKSAKESGKKDSFLPCGKDREFGYASRVQFFSKVLENVDDFFIEEDGSLSNPFYIIQLLLIKLIYNFYNNIQKY